MISIMKDKISAKYHIKQYLMHKYWGRKSYSIVNEYIKKFTKENDVILDPFMGSGVSIIESFKLKRKAIGVDLNPIACFIASTTLMKLDSTDIEKAKDDFNNIITLCNPLNNFLYTTTCINCKENAQTINVIWEGDTPKKIRGVCKKCGNFLKTPNIDDKLKIKYINDNFNFLCTKNKINKIPDAHVIKYVRRSGVKKISDLFTQRNLIALGFLRYEINKISNVNSKNLLRLAFSSMLPNVSSMIPGNISTGLGRSGWVISKLYIPNIHTERNVFYSFKQRFHVILKGKADANFNLIDGDYKIYNQSSEDLKNIIKKNSIDYIFTDPPYGENIPYFGCSSLFNVWLDFKIDYENEIILDTYRDKGMDDYIRRLTNVIKECYRVLKLNKYMTVTFNNRNFKIWNLILKIFLENGFELERIYHHESAVISGVQGLNKQSAIMGDFYHIFKKTNKNKSKKQLKIDFLKYRSVESYLYEKIKKIISKKDGVTISEIYKELIPILVKENMLERCATYIKNIDKILNNSFVLEIKKYNINNREKKIYKWKIKKSNAGRKEAGHL